jgi:hypothetical protein
MELVVVASTGIGQEDNKHVLLRRFHPRTHQTQPQPSNNLYVKFEHLLYVNLSAFFV